MSKVVKIGLGVVVVLGLAVGGFLWWFFRDDAPAKVSLDAATESVTGTTGTGDQLAPLDSLDGTWTVDTSTGDFDFESATGTFAGFRIQEQLSGIGSSTAVGRTGGVSGQAQITGDSLASATFAVDLTSITTNESRRDDRVQDALETSQFPTATFTLTQPVALPAGARSGDEVSVTAVGELTVHGQTRPVEVPLQAELVQSTIVVVGSVDLTFSDFGVTVPKAPIVLSVDDHGQIEVQLLLTRQA